MATCERVGTFCQHCGYRACLRETPQKNTAADDGALAPHTLGTGGQQTPSPGWREAAARIIDPDAWAERDRDDALNRGYTGSLSQRIDASRRKADQIASLPAPGGWFPPRDLLSIIRAVYDEYQRDEECDYTRLHQLLENAHQLVGEPLPEPPRPKP